jgi:hypothetical protein
MGPLSSVGAVRPEARGIKTSLLFKLLQQLDDQEDFIDNPEFQRQRDIVAEQERRREVHAQGEQLQRMRAQSGAHMQMVLGEHGVSPMYTMGVGSQGLSPAHIMAAARRSPVGRVR